MSSIQDKIDSIKTQKIGHTQKRVLLVEGDDDVDAISIFLNRKFSGWERKWAVEAAGNKKIVQKILRNEPTWIGMVDRDEWTSEEIEQARGDLPNLEVLARFCMESYLVEPNELWAALSQKQKTKISGGLPQFIRQIDGDKPRWLRHAAVWHVINPMWRRLRSLGFTDELLDSNAVLSDSALQGKLNDWSAALNPDTTFAAIQKTITDFEGESSICFYTTRLYAKNFYPAVIHDVLNKLLGQMSEKKRRLEIFRELPVPADLDSLWLKMNLP